MKYLIFIFLLFILSFSANCQGVRIGETPGEPDPSAIVDMNSTTRGALVPRMTSAQRNAIASPADGLQIFNTTTRCLEIFISPIWQSVFCGCNPPDTFQAIDPLFTQTEINWRWSEANGAEGYRYNFTDDYESATDLGLSTSFLQSTLTCNTGYELFVWAYNFCGRSEVLHLSQTTSLCCTPGDLVNDFGTGGAATSNPSGGDDWCRSITIDETGLYLAGYDIGPGNYALRVEKRDATNGALITSFGSGGVISNNPSAGTDQYNAVAVNDIGLFLGGYDAELGDRRWRIEKRDRLTGDLIAEFGSGGIILFNPSSGNDEVIALALDATGLYVAGYDNTPSNDQWRIEKRDMITGAVIWSKTTNPSSGSDVIFSLAINASGIYAGGSDSSPGNHRWRIEKRDLATGDLITGFGSSGVIAHNPSSGSDIVRALVVDATGLFAGGYDAIPGNDQWRIEKMDLTTGALISAFGSAGVITLNPSSGIDQLVGMTTDGIALFTTGRDNAPGNAQWRTEKRNLTTGAVIWSQTNNQSPNIDVSSGVCADGSSVYICGYDRTISSADLSWRVEKRCK